MSRTGSASAINAPPVVLAAIAVLFTIHAALWFLGPDVQVWSLYAFAFVPARLGGGPVIPMPEGAPIWMFVTYAFLHGDWIHLLFNSLWLLIFGTPVARYWGPWRFLAIAAAAAIGGGLATLALHWGEFVIMIGASGAVSGLMAAAIPIMYARSGQALTVGELLQDRRALLFMAIWLGVTLLTGSSGMGGEPFGGRNIAWEAHIGGFLAGLAALFVLERRR